MAEAGRESRCSERTMEGERDINDGRREENEGRGTDERWQAWEGSERKIKDVRWRKEQRRRGGCEKEREMTRRWRGGGEVSVLALSEAIDGTSFTLHWLNCTEGWRDAGGRLIERGWMGWEQRRRKLTTGQKRWRDTLKTAIFFSYLKTWLQYFLAKKLPKLWAARRSDKRSQWRVLKTCILCNVLHTFQNKWIIQQVIGCL